MKAQFQIVLILFWRESMECIDLFRYLQEQIHTTVIATTNDMGQPITCAIDLMDYDTQGLYFLTAKGKNFYQRLIQREYLSLTGIKGKDTMTCVAISLQGKVKEIGSDYLNRLLSKNTYMYEIYPTEASRKALTVFQIYEGVIEWFDLSKKPIERYSFSFGMNQEKRQGYYITDACISCGICLSVCPQHCIKINTKASIKEENCLHCGNCQNACPTQAVKRWS